MHKQYFYLTAGVCAAVIASFMPRIFITNFSHPLFWYTVIGVLAVAIIGLTVSAYVYAKRINPKTHLL